LEIIEVSMLMHHKILKTSDLNGRSFKTLLRQLFYIMSIDGKRQMF